ncbi:MAG: TGS domain-containing protein [Dehalococcoidia bacterium]|nr:TGS domain-containing protein [Dehalococcoidia bacterium]
MLTGSPRAGKAHVLAALTEATPGAVVGAASPGIPRSGIMKFEDIRIQVVEAPLAEGREKRILLPDALPGASLIAVIVDLSREPSSQVESSLQGFAERVTEPRAKAFGEIIPGKCSQKMLIVGNKNDVEGANNNWYILHSQYALRFPMIAISARKGSGIAELKKMIYELLDIIRIYPRTPEGNVAQAGPVVLKKDVTAKEAFQNIYEGSFCPRLDHAIIWNSDKREGQRVGKKHVLQDKDIVEFYLP